MDENLNQQVNNENDQTPQTEPVIEQAEQQVASESNAPQVEISGGASQAAAPRPKLSAALVTVIAVLVVGVIGVIASLFLTDSPEKAVHKAKTQTYNYLTQRSEKMINELPAIKVLNAEPSAQKTSFRLAFEGLQGGTDDLQLQMMGNLLKGFGISGDLQQNPTAKKAELNVQVGLGEMSLLDGYLYVSPEEAAFGVPKFSETIFSVNPTTLKDDYFASEIYKQMDDMFAQSPESKQYYDESMTEQLESFQKMLTMPDSSVMSPEAVKQMRQELSKRANGVLEGATYQKLPNEGNLKVYEVTLNGAAVKTTLIDLMRYIYLESPVVSSYYDMMPQSYMGMGMSYSELMETQLIQPLEQNLIDLPVKAVFKIDNKRIIRSLTATIDKDAINAAIGTNAGLSFEKGVFTFELGEQDSMSFNLDVNASSQTDGPIAMTMFVNEVYEQGTVTDHIGMDMNMGPIANMNVDTTLVMDQQGKFDINGSVLVDEGNYVVKMEGAAGGGVKVDGANSTWEYPAIDFKFSEGESVDTIQLVGGVTLSWKSESTPLTEDITPSRTFTPIFKMTVEQLEQESAKYEQAINSLFGQVMSLFGGGDLFGGGAIPETQSGPAVNEQAISEYLEGLSEEEFNKVIEMSEEEWDQLMLEKGFYLNP